MPAIQWLVAMVDAMVHAIVEERRLSKYVAVGVKHLQFSEGQPDNG